MRIVLVTSSLGRGGSERVMSLLASFWAEQGRDVTILVLNRGDHAAYPLHPAVKLQNLGIDPEPARNWFKSLLCNIRKISALRAVVRGLCPEIIISFIDRVNVVTVLATRVLGIPVIVSERTDPALHDVGSLWRVLRRLTYPFADAVVCQTNAALSYFQGRRVQGRVIPNPVVLPPGAQQKPDTHSTAHSMVGMGRLAPEKGFDVLIEAFSRTAERHPSWDLRIVGTGPLRSQLEEQARRLGVESRVVFTGELTDPFPALCAADLFILSSRFEGFPNALCEAMACGVPVVSFDCPSGPSEIIRDGVDGTLIAAGDVAGLAATMDRLMADPQERARLGSRAPEVLSRFSKDKILSLWERLFDDVLTGVRHEDRRTASANVRQ